MGSRWRATKIRGLININQGRDGQHDNPDHNSTMNQTVARDIWRQHQMGQNEDQSIKIKKQLRFDNNGWPIPTVSDKPIKSLGWCYDASLKECEQVQQLKQEVNRGLKNIDQSMPPGKLKLWCLQFGLLPWLMWPLTVVDIPITKVENMERVINSYVRKWLGVPRCLSNINLASSSCLSQVSPRSLNAPKTGWRRPSQSPETNVHWLLDHH